MRYKLIARLLGFFIIFIALNMTAALAWSVYYAEPVWQDFVCTMGAGRLELFAVLIYVVPDFWRR